MAFSSGASSGMELSESAIAAVLKPRVLRLLTGPSSHVQGTKNTDPIDTRTARRLSGSQELRVSRTASMPNAAAERNIAPMLVVSTTLSMTTMRRALQQTSSSARGCGRRMAQSTPRVVCSP